MTENSHKMTKLAPQVVVLAYDGLCTFEFGVAVEIFGLPRPEMGNTGIALPWLQLMKVSYAPPAACG